MSTMTKPKLLGLLLIPSIIKLVHCARCPCSIVHCGENYIYRPLSAHSKDLQDKLESHRNIRLQSREKSQDESHEHTKAA